MSIKRIRYKHKFCGILLIFALLSIFCTSLASESWAAGNYEFARPGDRAAITYTAADILEQLGYSLDDVEKQYLASHDNFKFTYSSEIPASAINFDFTDGILSVSDVNYSYTAVNGTTVSWKPQKAVLDGRELTKSGDKWTTEVVKGDGDIVTVEYEWSATIANSDINSFINKTRDAAVAAKNKIDAEEARYQQEVAAYEKYIADLAQYERDYAVYAQYLKDYAAWKRAYSAYSAYLEDYAEYLQELEDYYTAEEQFQKYQEALKKYQQYKAEMEIYEEKLAKYNKDMASYEVQKAVYQLSVLEYINLPVGIEHRALGPAILGESVAQVLNETEALVMAGAERAAVNRANAATVVLRTLLAQYDSLSTDEERYMFYISAYEELRENFNVLLRTLDYFLSFKALRGELSKRGKTEAFEVLIAQLYYLCNALDNNPIANYIQEYKYDKTGGAYFDSSYTIGASKRTPASVVGVDGVLEDSNDALPLETGYPGIPEMPVKPKEVPNPGPMPQRPKMPVEPDKVKDPGDAPDEVYEPIKPTAPKTPKRYVPTAEETTLAAALDGGKLPARTTRTSNYVMPIPTSVTSKYFRNVRRITVNFYQSENESEPLYTIYDAEIGYSIEYPYDAPTKEREGYTCTFDYWVDGDGKYINFDNLQTEKSVLDLYPHFEETPNRYDVTWIVDGEEYHDSCVYGEYPVYDEDAFMRLDEVGDGVRFYRFAGWKRLSDGEMFNELPAMTTEAVSYEAVFEISFLITWVLENDIVYLPIWGGEIPVFDGIPQKEADEFARFVFAGWDKEIVPAVQDETYVAQFKAEYYISSDESGDFVGAIEKIGDTYVAYCENASSSTFSLGGLLNVAAEDSCAVKILLESSTLSLTATSVYEAVQSGVDKMTLQAIYVEPSELQGLALYAMSATHTYRYGIQLIDKDGKEVFPADCSFAIVTTGDFDAQNSHLTAIDKDGNETDVRFSITDTTLSFTMRAGYVYELCPRFRVGIMSSDYVDISVSVNLAEYGEIVKIELGEPKVGMYVRSVYVIDADGNDVEVDADLTFRMPQSTVTVGVNCDFYEYTIVFKADGKILVSKKLKYGEQIVPPADPIKAADSEYQYTFAGWDKELGYVTGDMEFEAIFTKEPLPVIPKHESKLTKIIKFVRIGVPVIIAIIFLVRFALLFIVLWERSRKRHEEEQADGENMAVVVNGTDTVNTDAEDNNIQGQEMVTEATVIVAEGNQLNKESKKSHKNKKNQTKQAEKQGASEATSAPDNAENTADTAQDSDDKNAVSGNTADNTAYNSSENKSYNKRVIKIKKKK